MSNADVVISPTRGKELVSNKDLRPGDLVLSEKAFAAALQINQTSNSFCFLCCSVATSKYTCNGCGYSFCSSTCATSEKHKLECHNLKKIEEYCKISMISFTNAVILLRAIVNSLHDRENFDRITQLTSHKEYKDMHSFLAFASHFFKFLPPGVSLNVDNLVELFCIVENTSFGLSGDPTASPHASGIYVTSSLFSHSCTPNVYYSNYSPTELRFYAIKDIKQGEPLFISYVDILYPTWQRQQTLLRTKHFLCTCERCNDPTEQGKYISAVKCTCGGYIVPIPPASLPNVSENSHKNFTFPVSWVCDKCHATPADINSTNEALHESLDFLYSQRWQTNPHSCLTEIRDTIQPLLGKVHPQHALQFYCHLCAANAYGALKQLPKAVEHATAVCVLAKKLLPPNFGEISQYYNMLGIFYEETANKGTEKVKLQYLGLARMAYMEAYKVAQLSCGLSADWTILLGESIARTKVASMRDDFGRGKGEDIQADISESIPLRSATKSNFVQIIVGAAKKGNLGRLEAAIRKDPTCVSFPDEFSRSPVHYAALNGHAECLQFLLQKGADANVEDRHGMTPLHYAASGHKLDCMKVLIKFHADVNRRKPGNTPLGNCASSDTGTAESMYQCVQFLLSAGADPNIGSRFFPIHNVSIDGNVPVLELFLKHGANIDSLDSEYGNTPLHYAALSGHADAVKFLLSKGAKVLKNKEGVTPQQLATSAGQTEIANLLAINASNSNLCAVCCSPATNRCAGCHKIYYCSREHQKSDWSHHKPNCKP